MAMLPRVREVMALIPDMRSARAGGAPVTLQSVSGAFINELPHLLFQADGGFSAMIPDGGSFEECIK